MRNISTFDCGFLMSISVGTAQQPGWVATCGSPGSACHDITPCLPTAAIAEQECSCSGNKVARPSNQCTGMPTGKLDIQKCNVSQHSNKYLQYLGKEHIEEGNWG